MKTKQIIAIVSLALVFASCSQYTCPTYAKARPTGSNIVSKL